jgi:NADH-ubiquinone oxidoreductase chain 1
MTEHAAVIFIFFFLAEYASIILICIFTTALYLGGYLLDLNFFNMMYMYVIEYIDYEYYINIVNNANNNNLLFSPLEEGILYGLILGIKTCFMIFVFIWIRASFPRIRFDQLMSYCWIVLLPLVLAIIILIPCIIYSCGILPTNIMLF